MLFHNRRAVALYDNEGTLPLGDFGTTEDLITVKGSGDGLLCNAGNPTLMVSRLSQNFSGS